MKLLPEDFKVKLDELRKKVKDQIAKNKVSEALAVLTKFLETHEIDSHYKERIESISTASEELSQVMEGEDIDYDEYNKSADNQMKNILGVLKDLEKYAEYTFFLLYDLLDNAFATKLKIHLSFPLKKRGLLLFDMHKFNAGDEKDRIHQALGASKYALVLVSAYLLYNQSDLVLKAKEMGVKVIPVLLRDTEMGDSFLADLSRLPSDRRPVSQWPNEDAAYTDIVRHLLKLLD